jgi:fatty-acyl-CoA synthase
VTWTGAGPRRTSYAQVAQNAGRLAGALARLGIGPGDPVATFCWNNTEHLEAYFGVPSMGAVLHTLNIRLPGAQVAQIVNHAEDRIIIVDDTLVPLLAKIADELPTVEAFIVNGTGRRDRARATGCRCCATPSCWRPRTPAFDWPELDERDAALMCYTSGTTGDPKGVVYSHRSTYLHAMAVMAASVQGITEADRALAIVPMFHANAWGMPYAAFLSGATLHMPGPFLQPEHLTVHRRRTDHGDVRGADHLERDPGLRAGPRDRPVLAADRQLGRLGRAPGAARAVPGAVRAADHPGLGHDRDEPGRRHGAAARGGPEGTPEDLDWRMRAGRVLHGVEMRIIGKDGEELPRDGVSEGEIEVRGPWVTGSYHHDPAPEKFHDGWLRTGDVGTLDDRGFFTITDRIKDVIKSGGEWISSVDLENQLMAHPAVQEAAVIGIPDERWGERPLACVVLRPGAKARRGARRLPGRQGRALAGAGVLGVRGRDPEDGGRQVRQEGAPRPSPGCAPRPHGPARWPSRRRTGCAGPARCAS